MGAEDECEVILVRSGVMKIEVKELLSDGEWYYYVEDEVFDMIKWGDSYIDGRGWISKILFKESNIMNKFYGGESKQMFYGQMHCHTWFEGCYKWEDRWYGMIYNVYYRRKRSYKGGMLHNELGPAYMLIRMDDGLIEDEDYYLWNKGLSKGEWEGEMLTKLYW